MLQLVGLYLLIFTFNNFVISPIESNKDVLGVNRSERVISPLSRSDKFEKKFITPVATVTSVTPTRIASTSSIPVRKKIRVIPTTSVESKITPVVSEVVSDASISKQEYLIHKINEYRRSHGLGDVVSNDLTCSFARIRADEISRDFSHAGFRHRIESKTLPYPDYKNVTENIAMNSDYTKVVDMWINSSGHAENMRKDTPFVCVGIAQNYFAYEGFSP